MDSIRLRANFFVGRNGASFATPPIGYVSEWAREKWLNGTGFKAVSFRPTSCETGVPFFCTKDLFISYHQKEIFPRLSTSTLIKFNYWASRFVIIHYALHIHSQTKKGLIPDTISSLSYTYRRELPKSHLIKYAKMFSNFFRLDHKQE